MKTNDSRPSPPTGRGRGWLLVVAAVPVLCCAGPGLLAAAGVTSLGAGIALGTGAMALGGVLSCLLIALLVVARRRRR